MSTRGNLERGLFLGRSVRHFIRKWLPDQADFTSELWFTGHMGLGRLIVIYDSNHITIDGSTELAFTEDVAARFAAYKWHVQTLPQSLDNDFRSILETLENAKAETTQPSIIIANTTIAYGSLNQGHHKSE